MRSKSEKLIEVIVTIRAGQRRLRWWTAALSLVVMGIFAYAAPHIFVGRPSFKDDFWEYGIWAILLAYFSWTAMTTVINSYRIEKVLLPYLERWLYQSLRQAR